MTSNIPLNGMPVNPKNGGSPFSGQRHAVAQNRRMGSEKGKPKRIRSHTFDVDLAKQQVASNLRAIRADAGMTVADFANKLGTKPSTMDNWLRGDTWPQGDGVIALAQMGYNPNFLFLGVGPMKRPEKAKPAKTKQERQAAVGE
jgi:DNA-binding transcriptional regulator YiaG